MSTEGKSSCPYTLIELLMELKMPTCYMVADAYYSCRAVMSGLAARGYYLVSRVRTNAVAYYQCSNREQKRRGRKRKYGKKVVLSSFFNNLENFNIAPSFLYDDNGKVNMKWYSCDLLCRSAGRFLRYVFLVHPTRGRWILVTTDMNLAPLEVIEAYGRRFKIEVTFKQSLETIGVFAYKFWSKIADRIKRGTGNQYLHRKSEKYRKAISDKMRAYNLFIQLGLIAQGLIMYLATCNLGCRNKLYFGLKYHILASAG